MTQIEAMKQMVSALQSMVCEPDRTLQQRPERYAKVKEAISAGRQAIEQAEKQEPVACVQDLEEVKRKHLVYEMGMDWKDPLYTHPQPKAEQEPVAWIEHHKGGDNLNWEEVNHPYAKATPLYTSPQPQKPSFKTFIKWAGEQGYDCAQTCNSDTGEWLCLNPMTADLWKAWQAAHNIKEKA